MGSFKVQYAAKSDIGRKRSSNQDSIIVQDQSSLYAVADGMGGHSGGEVASALAVKTLEKVLRDNLGKGSCADILERAVKICNQVIYQQSQNNPDLHGMGTTLTACVVNDPYVHIAQVGDSRCYLYRKGELYQITEDHSQVYEILKAGLITEESMSSFQNNVITRSVGYEEKVDVDIYNRIAHRGDRYLICSDGLTGMVSNEQITRILYNFDIDQSVQNLVELANQQGGEDNISVVIFEIK